jgi:predicted metalloendopeptidase
MKRTLLVVLGLMLAVPARSETAGPGAPAAGAVPGIDFAGFDRAVRPQDDFFQYVNGGWLKSTEIPGDLPMYDSFLVLFERSEAAQRVLLDGLASRKDLSPGSIERKLADYYASFMDEGRIESLGAKPLAPRVAAIRAIRDKGGLVSMMADLACIGVSVPIGPAVEPDYADSNRYLLRLGQSGLTLPDRDYYLLPGAKFEALREGYPAFAEGLLRLSGLTPSPGRGRALLDLETRLARGQWPVADVQNISKTANKYATVDLGKVSERVPWTVFLEGTGVGDVATVNVDEPSYVTAFGEALDEVSLDTWKDYLVFQLAQDAAPHLSRAFVDANFEYGRRISGLKEQAERWKRGVRSVNGAMGEALGQLYVREHFPPESKRRMEELVSNLLEAMRADIGRLDWMTDETKEAARAKLAKFKARIGHPDKWRDYSRLEVRREDHIGNYWRANQFEHERQIAKLGKPVDHDEWELTPQTVNAYYSPPHNQIVFPAAILQPPFFDPAADEAVNYGAIGAVIGHEISHGFDDEGRKYDGDGNLRDWWQEADSKAFLERTRVLVEQYGAFQPLPDLHVNGELTLGENIGDLSGLAIAWSAYHRSLEGRTAPVLGGLTGDQRFFIGFAQIWRGKLREEFMRQIVVSDEHSPNPFRVNGVLANMPEFYQAFGVKPGDGLYLPEEKRVKIW